MLPTAWMRQEMSQRQLRECLLFCTALMRRLTSCTHSKGYSIGSAALACFLLFGALMDEFSAFVRTRQHVEPLSAAV